jgi:hypothetical protein
VLFQHNAHVGVSLASVNASLESVHVLETTFRSVSLTGGGGVAITGCADVEATGLRIEGSNQYGLLIDGASATLGAAGEGKGLLVGDNPGGGLWAGGIQPHLFIANASFTGNGGVGVHIGAGSQDVTISTSAIENTLGADLPTTDGKIDSMGDGLIWGAGAVVAIDGLAMSKSARNALLIDGAVGAGSTLKNVTLSEGDETKGIVQQNVRVGTGAPALESAPELSQSAGQIASIPETPEAPVAVSP